MAADRAIGLFAAPPHARESAVAGVAMQSMPDCPHHHHQQHNSDGQGDSACPMCQALGCAADPAGNFGASERLIGRLRIEASAP